MQYSKYCLNTSAAVPLQEIDSRHLAKCGYSVDTLDIEMVHVLGTMEQDSGRFKYIIQSGL